MDKMIFDWFDHELENSVNACFDVLVLVDVDVEVLDCNLLDLDIDIEVCLALYKQSGTEFQWGLVSCHGNVLKFLWKEYNDIIDIS